MAHTPAGLTRRSKSDLTKYDPIKGLKTVAVAEAAEKHFARAKDASKLQMAIRAKLEAQAEFVFWWDTKGPGTNHGAGRGHKKISDLKSFSEDLPSPIVVHRWRAKLNEPEKFEATFQKVYDRYIRIVEFRTGSTAGMNYPESNEWYTPAKYVEAAREVMGGIDLDPASSLAANKTIQATTIYTVADDGLRQPWNGRVWLNPPYSGKADEFVARLVQTFTASEVSEAVLLVNSHGTDTAWFQPLWNTLICFTNHRINFISPASGTESGSNHGSVFAYFGPRRGAFIKQFSQFGAVVERAV